MCGIGAGRADAAAKILLKLGVEAMISWGTAAALSRELQAGDLLLPESVLASAGRRYTADRPWLGRIRHTLQHTSITIHSGPVTDTREILTGVAQKQELHVRTRAIAADMETAIIMENADAGKLPCIAIRSVVDEADMAIPESLLRHINSMGRPEPAGLLLEMCRSPRLLGTLWRLGLAMHRATSTLKAVARRTDSVLMYGK